MFEGSELKVQFATGYEFHKRDIFVANHIYSWLRTYCKLLYSRQIDHYHHIRNAVALILQIISGLAKSYSYFVKQ